jgi:transcriptional regulator with XRE-family HTH domain
VCIGFDFISECGIVDTTAGAERKMTMFGEFVKSLRVQRGKTLREFCLAGGRDPSNWSKMERGLLPPPQEQETLEKMAMDLGLKRGGTDWMHFFDLAAAEAGKIPSDLMDDSDLVQRLPLFFRTLRGQKPTPKEMRTLAELLRRS